MSGIKGLLNLCFIPHPLLQNHQRISIINCFDAKLMLNCLKLRKKMILFDYVVYQNAVPKMKFLSIFTYARDRCFVTSEYVTDKWLWL